MVIRAIGLVLSVTSALFAPQSRAQSTPTAQALLQAPARSTGQTLYLPIYSHIWHGDVDKKGQPARTLVSVSVSVRNTDPQRSLRLLSARYFDTEGRSLREFIDQPRLIGPMGTYEIFVPRSDDTGGSGANFVLVWKADQPTNPPVVEGVHAHFAVGRSMVFTSTARPITAD